MLIDGFDVLDQIATTPTNPMDKPIEEQRVKTISVDLNGVELGMPEMLK
jgi:hypothetical protein